MNYNLCDLPELCLIKIFCCVGRDRLDEVKLSCKYINQFLYSQKLLKKAYSVRVKMSGCLGNNRPIQECSCDVWIKEKNCSPRSEHLQFKHTHTADVNQYGYSVEYFYPYMEWPTDEEFEHPCLASKLFFEWMAKEWGNCRFEKFNIVNVSLDDKSLRCWGRLARKYGIRAIHVDFYDRDTTSALPVSLLLNPFQLSSLTYRPAIGAEWKMSSHSMGNLISSLQSFKGHNKRSSSSFSLHHNFSKFPPHFAVEGGIKVTVDTFVDVIRNWYKDELDFENIEWLTLPEDFTSVSVLASKIDLPYSITWTGVPNIIIHKSENESLHLFREWLPSEDVTWRISKCVY